MASELAEAERYARTGAATRPPHELLAILITEYDQRGAELDAARGIIATERGYRLRAEAAIERVRELCDRGIAEDFHASWAFYVLRALDGGGEE